MDVTNTIIVVPVGVGLSHGERILEQKDCVRTMSTVVTEFGKKF